MSRGFLLHIPTRRSGSAPIAAAPLAAKIADRFVAGAAADEAAHFFAVAFEPLVEDCDIGSDAEMADSMSRYSLAWSG